MPLDVSCVAPDANSLMHVSRARCIATTHVTVQRPYQCDSEVCRRRRCASTFLIYFQMFLFFFQRCLFLISKPHTSQISRVNFQTHKSDLTKADKQLNNQTIKQTHACPIMPLEAKPARDRQSNEQARKG